MKSPFAVLVVGALVLAGGTFLFLNNPTTEGDGNNANMTASTGTFASLMTSDKDLECTFTHDDGSGNVSSGVVYFTKGAKEIRGDFSIQESAAGNMEVHLIRAGGYNYLWGSSYPQGIQSKVSAEDEAKLFTSAEGAGIDENTTFDCNPWSVDQGKFLTPSDVTFTDVSAMLEASAGVEGL